MKKTLALTLAIFLLATLFAACGSGSEAKKPSSGNEPDVEKPIVTQDPDSPYNFAIGDYDVDEDGFPTVHIHTPFL